MAIYLISYDLNTPGQDYKHLHAAIRELGAWTHPLDSVWIVDCDHTAAEIRDTLKYHIDSNDTLIVVRLQGAWASWNMSTNTVTWLKKHL
ncbi:SinR family protein [Sorangium sp. So ce693]|uniref:SinR family protein n=1 Tax=Sorangium sp. So ce693 TaxID=3133318 RepID=UPI003F61B25F